MPSNTRRFVGAGILAGFAFAAVAGTAAAQDNSWPTLIQEADSIGPETPAFAPSRWTPCAPVLAADSVRVAGPADEFLFAVRSLRTRGYFSYREPPEMGSASFALRAILCDEETGRPRTFVLERDHRYFYLVFSLRDVPTYRAVTLFTGSASGSCLRWAPEPGRFGPVACSGAGGRKC